MFVRTRIVAVGLLAIGALLIGAPGFGVGTAQAATTHTTSAMAAPVPSQGYAPAIRIPRPGQDDGRGGNFQAPHNVRSSAPSTTGQQAGGAAAGAAPGGAVPAPDPVSGLLAPVVGALHL